MKEVLFDPVKVDLVALSGDGSSAYLYIVNDSPWTGSDQQLMSLRNKIHNYVGFAVDGQMIRMHPETEGLAWSIVIDDQAGAARSAFRARDRTARGSRAPTAASS